MFLTGCLLTIVAQARGCDEDLCLVTGTATTITVLLVVVVVVVVMVVAVVGDG